MGRSLLGFASVSKWTLFISPFIAKFKLVRPKFQRYFLEAVEKARVARENGSPGFFGLRFSLLRRSFRHFRGGSRHSPFRAENLASKAAPGSFVLKVGLVVVSGFKPLKVSDFSQGI